MKKFIITAVFTLVLQAAYGQQKPKNVILLIGDGMGAAQMSTAFYYNEKGEPNFARFPITGLVKTSSSKEKITDSAAGATAYSTGKKTYNGAIAVDDNKDELKTLAEVFSEQGKATAVISTSSVTHATPASFYAHVNSRHQEKKIARQLVDSEIDFFAGGGKSFFTEGLLNKNLLEDAKEVGLQIFTDSLRSASELKVGQRYGFLLSEDGMPKMSEDRGDFLPEATELALEFLSKDENGFFLMVEGSQIDWGGHANNADYIIQEVLDFDEAVGKALDFAEKNGNTLVIVTADHETGGFSLSSAKKKVPFQGMRSDYENIKPTFSTGGHSATMVPLLAFGPGSEVFSGIYENVAVHAKIMALLSY